MTVSRGKIEKSLAERGRPAMWANEQEAAVLSGVSYDIFRTKVAEWEAKGFPPRSALNGKRFIPAIEHFAAAEGTIAVPVDNTASSNFYERIEHLPEAIQKALCSCLGSQDEILAKRRHANLVCEFGKMGRRPAVRYRYGDAVIRAAILCEAGSSWQEITPGQFAVAASTMTFKAWATEFGTALPPLPDWLFQHKRRHRQPANSAPPRRS
jgi:hypothetical protein